jgi:hypothetical protein
VLCDTKNPCDPSHNNQQPAFTEGCRKNRMVIAGEMIIRYNHKAMPHCIYSKAWFNTPRSKLRFAEVHSAVNAGGVRGVNRWIF